MGLTTAGLVPIVRLLANGDDITSTIAERFSSLRLTDETGDSSDTLEIVLADHDPANPIVLPPTGAELDLSIGYFSVAQRMGLFACDEVELSGWPSTLTLRARAAIYTETPLGKMDFQTQKTRSWNAGTKIGGMVAAMASEHGMKAAVSASLASVQLPHMQQDAESDINLLLRLAKRYDATAKPAGGVLVFAKRGEAKTLSGVALPTKTIRPQNLASWRMIKNTRGTAGTVVAYYHSRHEGKRHEIKVGDGDPVQRIRYWFKNEAEALAAATAGMQRRQRAGTRFEFRMQGDPTLMAEAPLILQGFRDGVPVDWIITRIVHSISKSGAYVCDGSAELPNSSVIGDIEEDTADDIPENTE